ncbi:C1GALT1-specific chaperone 1-like [Lampetra fluviatilis]
MFGDYGSFFKGLLLGALCCVLATMVGNVIHRKPTPAERRHADHPHVPESESSESRDHGHRHHDGLPPPQQPEQRRREASEALRVLCMVMTKPKTLSHWAAARETWTRHCDGTVFYSPEEVKAYSSVPVGAGDTWSQTARALRHAHDAHVAVAEDGEEGAGEEGGDRRPFGWFLLVQDSTFAIVENLKYYVHRQQRFRDPEEPFYAGKVASAGELKYAEMAAGLVLSRGALRRLRAALDDRERCPESGGFLWKTTAEKQLATCLLNVGVQVYNAEDTEKRELFSSQHVDVLVSAAMQRASQRGEPAEGCCSDLAVTFGGVSPNQMRVLMYGVYRLRSFGRSYADQLYFLPVPGADND